MFLFPRETSLKRQRADLMKSMGYLANPNFLSTSSWLAIAEDRGKLYGPHCRFRKTCVIVGRVSSSNTFLRPHGNYKGGHTGTLLEDAQHSINLEQPTGIPGFDEDFPSALETLSMLSCFIPAPTKSVDVSTTPKELLLLSHIFVERPTGKERHDSLRFDLKHYPISMPFRKELDKLLITHQLRDVEWWKHEMRILPEDLERTLVGEVVKVTFEISFSPDGLGTDVRTVEVL